MPYMNHDQQQPLPGRRKRPRLPRAMSEGGQGRKRSDNGEVNVLAAMLTKRRGHHEEESTRVIGATRSATAPSRIHWRSYHPSASQALNRECDLRDMAAARRSE